MADAFDREFWEQRWDDFGAPGPASMATGPPHPHLAREVGGLVPGTALDAGCGAGAEALWLASRGWQVTGADISSSALARAAQREAAQEVAAPVRWVEADLSVWEPTSRFDLVTSHYAHPAMPQLDFYTRLASWVVPGGTLLIVGHLHTHGPDAEDHPIGHGQHPAADTLVTAAAIVARLAPGTWTVVTAEESQRTLAGPGGRETLLQDVVVRAARQPRPGRFTPDSPPPASTTVA